MIAGINYKRIGNISKIRIMSCEDFNSDGSKSLYDLLSLSGATMYINSIKGFLLYLSKEYACFSLIS